MIKRLITIVVLLFLPLFVYSQSQKWQGQKKVALLIGNGNYSSSILANPENDARAMKMALENVGFEVLEYENLNQVQMKKAIDDFGVRLRGSDVGLFFYAGHGVQSNGYNYLIPVDAILQSEQDIEYNCVEADRVLAKMEAGGSKVNILILDACRNNPFERSWTRSSAGRGLAFMNAPRGSLIAYATSPGSTASDGSGKNGLYTSAILENIVIPDITILQMFQNVRNIVAQKSSNKQIPWESTSLTGDFYLSRADAQFKTIRIGNSIWMADNLSTGEYNDGTPIPLIEGMNEWSNLKNPGFCWYENDPLKSYGALYNWYAVNSGKLCPKGWHVPSDNDWTELSNFLGGETITGGKLKETGTKNWRTPNAGASNETDFKAFPGGFRFFNGQFSDIGINGFWWSSSEFQSGTSWSRVISYNSRNIGSLNFNKNNGFSVRCIKDL